MIYNKKVFLLVFIHCFVRRKSDTELCKEYARFLEDDTVSSLEEKLGAIIKPRLLWERGFTYIIKDISFEIEFKEGRVNFHIDYDGKTYEFTRDVPYRESGPDWGLFFRESARTFGEMAGLRKVKER